MNKNEISAINEKLFKEKMKEMGLLVPITDLEGHDNSYIDGFTVGWEKGYEQGMQNAWVCAIGILKAAKERGETEEPKRSVKKTARRRKVQHGCSIVLADENGNLFPFISQVQGSRFLNRSDGYIKQCISKGTPIYARTKDGHRGEEYIIWEEEKNG